MGALLSAEDRETLTRALIRDMSRGGDQQTFEAVEAIVTRHVAAALYEAASRIHGQALRHMFAAENKMRGPKERDEHYAAQVASEDAARIVRAAIPKPPASPREAVALGDAGRTPGTT